METTGENKTLKETLVIGRWTEAIDELRDKRTTDEQISHVINILKKSHTFLSIAANTYNAIFMK